MAFAVSAKKMFTKGSDNSYSHLRSQSFANGTIAQDPRFPAAAPWTQGHNVYRVVDSNAGAGYITDNRAASGEKAHFR